MELTGKCLEDFNKWKQNKGIENFNAKNYSLDIAKTIYFSILKRFFDSKEIFIHVKRNCTGIKFNHWYCIITDVKGVHINNFLKDESKEDNRNLILNCAIKKANEIYNLHYEVICNKY